MILINIYQNKIKQVLNKTQSNVSLTNRSQNDSSLNETGNNRVFNYKEREIDNKIKKIMLMKKRVSPYLNNNS